MDIPELTTETASKAKNKTKNLIPWLPDPYICDECEVYCDAERTYDPQTAAFHPNGMAPSWVCPECGTAYRRERV